MKTYEEAGVFIKEMEGLVSELDSTRMQAQACGNQELEAKAFYAVGLAIGAYLAANWACGRERELRERVAKMGLELAMNDINLILGYDNESGGPCEVFGGKRDQGGREGWAAFSKRAARSGDGAAQEGPGNPPGESCGPGA